MPQGEETPIFDTAYQHTIDTHVCNQVGLAISPGMSYFIKTIDANLIGGLVIKLPLQVI
jgi:hypothetical protein